MSTKKILRDLRIERRLTQQEVAAKLKVSQSYYSSIERGQKPSEIPVAIKVVSGMRKRISARTAGGDEKVGRLKK